MIKRNTSWKIVFIFCLLTLGLTGSIACESTGYKVMSVRDGIQGFSFEYPQNYSLIQLHLENTPSVKYSQVGLSAGESNSYSEIYVYIWPPTADMNSSELIIDKLIENSRNSLKDFSLVQERALMLGDTVARQIMFTADSSYSDNSSQPISRPATFRITSMIYAGLAIEIDMTCDNSLVDMTEADYQHILDTFAILD